MALTQDDHRKIGEIFRRELDEKDERVRLLVQKEIIDFCPMDDLCRDQAPHGVGIIMDLGQGDLRAGLREFRYNQFWTQKIRRRSEGWGSSVTAVVIVVVVSGLLAALWTGIRILTGLGGK